MRTANPELEQNIKKGTLELLIKKEPYEIGMRDIAQICGVSAAAIYHYYKDKDSLFEAVKLDCLASLKICLEKRISEETETPLKAKAAFEAFRDWCFDNPPIALLVMGKLKANTTASREELKAYYECNETGLQLLEQGIREGCAVSDDPRLDTAVLISGLWGTIEAILLKRADSAYWNSGKAYTDRYITICMGIFFPHTRHS